MVQVSPEAWQQANRKWRLTPNYQIVDLNRFQEFWYDDVESSGEHKVFGKDIDGIEWNIFNAGCSDDAQYYVNELYSILKQ